MGARKPTWTILNKWSKTVLYSVSWQKKVINVEVESIADRIGALKRVQSSITNDFEEYGMQAVKNRINSVIQGL